MRVTFRLFGVLGSCILLASCGAADKTSKPGSQSTPTTTVKPTAVDNQKTPVDERPVIVALGDSLTAGYGVDVSESYPFKLQTRLDLEGYAYRVVNAGASGDTTAQGLNRLQVVLDLNPAIVIVELGPNDGLRGLLLEATRKNLREIIERCQAVGARVVLAGMTLPPNYGPLYIREFEQMYVELAREYDTQLIPFFLEGVAARPELNISDEVHPNGAGYTIVTNNVWQALEPLLEK